VAKKRKPDEEVKRIRPERVKLSREEVLKRMADFPKRKAKFIASIRRGRQIEEVKILRPERIKLTEEECLERMTDFPKRRAQFIASIRKSKDRGSSSD
jgi:inosine/xanthosine triphosphate pyrophosphatase family protein